MLNLFCRCSKEKDHTNWATSNKSQRSLVLYTCTGDHFSWIEVSERPGKHSPTSTAAVTNAFFIYSLIYYLLNDIIRVYVS
jgi:hypothetical protein